MVAVKKAGGVAAGKTVGSKGGSKKGGKAEQSYINPDLSFADSDFAEVVSVRSQTRCVIFADTGEGKTHLSAFFAPPPVTIINFDNRGEKRAKEARKAGRRVLYAHIPYPADVSHMDEDTVKKLARESVSRSMHNLEVAVRESQRGNCRTICIDTGTEFSDMVNISNTGTRQSAKGDYGRSKGLLNSQWLRVYRLAKEGNAHLIVLARAKEIWFDNKPTGFFTYRGPEAMVEGADWVAHLRTRKSKRTGKPRMPIRYELEITKSGDNKEELGEVYTEDDWEGLGGPFAYAAMMQNPDTTPEDWE